MSIEIETHGPVMLITIARPDVMNCLDAAANEELGRAWDQFENSSEALVAVLTGKGEKSFSAGADLKSLIPSQRAAVAASAEDQAPVWGFGGGLARGRRLTKPVVAAVNGHCLAGGLEMALGCDIRICSPNARFGLAEVKWAIIPGAGGTQRLPRAVALGMALEMIMTGDPIDADEALRVGLVNRVVPSAELIDSAMELAQRIASRGPLAVRAAREAIYAGLDNDFETGMEIEERLFNETIRSEDAAEGPRAFAEKRPPQFKGR